MPWQTLLVGAVWSESAGFAYPSCTVLPREALAKARHPWAIFRSSVGAGVVRSEGKKKRQSDWEFRGDEQRTKRPSGHETPHQAGALHDNNQKNFRYRTIAGTRRSLQTAAIIHTVHVELTYPLAVTLGLNGGAQFFTYILHARDGAHDDGGGGGVRGDHGKIAKTDEA